MAYSLFYDSTTPSAIPNRSLAAYYTNGAYGPGVWTRPQRLRMGGVFGISTTPGNYGAASLARCLDVETGDASIHDAVPFIKARMGFGHRDATIYCNRSTWGQVWPLIRATRGLVYRFWIATGDGTRVALPGDWAPGSPNPWAVQYLWPPLTGGHFDRSILYGTNDFARPN